LMLPPTRPGANIRPSASSTPPAIVNHTTGRHRGLGGRPFGNSRNTRSTAEMAGVAAHVNSQAASPGAGSDPGAGTRPRRRYSSRPTAMTAKNQAPMNNQPSLHGLRETTGPPTDAWTTPPDAATPSGQHF